jgi:HSP20 family molecular chaperone IbpA
MKTRNTQRWMWAEALDLLEDAGRLQSQFFRLGESASRQPCWEPPVDAYESGGELWLYFALPGVPAEGVQVLQQGDSLIVRGDRKLPAIAAAAAIRQLEIPYGAFERRIGLPAGHFELLEHQLDKGCLVIGLRRIA